MSLLSASAIASRVRQLIDAEDNGNVSAAAQRLGVSYGALAKLLEAESRNVNLDTITALVRGYQVDACWLLTGERDVTSQQIAGDQRGQLADALFEIGRGLVERARRPADLRSTSEKRLDR